MEKVQRNLTELMILPCFDRHQGVTWDEDRQIETPHRCRPPKAQSRHRSLQMTWGLLFDDSIPDRTARTFLRKSHSVRTVVWTKVRYTVYLVYCETDGTGYCFQNYCWNSWSCDSVWTQNRRGGDAWYKEGGVIDQEEGTLQRRSRQPLILRGDMLGSVVAVGTAGIR
jgi:hypothetical protein